MYLVRLVYASTISDQFEPEDIDRILSKARESNAKMSLTGVLCFSSRYFLQCLEGSRVKVNQTYHKILHDPRHCDLVMLGYEEITERQFDNWSMGYVPQSSMTHELNLRYSVMGDFNPYQMRGESAHQLLVTAGKAIPIV